MSGHALHPGARPEETPRAERALRRTLVRLGARCATSRGGCCALWSGTGIMCRGVHSDVELFAAGIDSRPQTAPSERPLLVVYCEDADDWSVFNDAQARRFWWNQMFNSPRHSGVFRHHWHVYCGRCLDDDGNPSWCVLCRTWEGRGAGKTCTCGPAPLLCDLCSGAFGGLVG